MTQDNPNVYTVIHEHLGIIEIEGTEQAWTGECDLDQSKILIRLDFEIEIQRQFEELEYDESYGDEDEFWDDLKPDYPKLLGELLKGFDFFIKEYKFVLKCILWEVLWTHDYWDINSPIWSGIKNERKRFWKSKITIKEVEIWSSDRFVVTYEVEASGQLYSEKLHSETYFNEW